MTIDQAREIGEAAIARERARREVQTLENSGSKQPLREAKRALSLAEQALDTAVAAVIAEVQS